MASLMGTVLGRTACLLALASPVTAQTIGVSTHETTPSEVARYAEVGFKVVRFDLAYTFVNRDDGQHWEVSDAFVANLYAHGLTPLVILQWDGDKPVAESIPEFSRFAGEVASRYPVAIFEVLNEPNMKGEAWRYVEPEDYVAVVAAVSSAVRRHSSAKVIGPALGGVPLDAAYLGATFQAGLLRYVDAVSIHPYFAAAPEDAPHGYAQVRGMMGRQEKPLVVSEWGFLTDEATQADLTRRALQVNAAHDIGLTVLYRWRDAPGHTFGFVREDGTLKPVAAVVGGR